MTKPADKLEQAYFDVGTHSFPITTSNIKAQIWFDRGLMWIYGYNHEEAVDCFKRALREDPHCAMAHWGIAYAAGPFYNMPWAWFSSMEAEEATLTCHNAAQRAKETAEGCSALEKGMIEAVLLRYQEPRIVPQEDFDRWDREYAAAMEALLAKFPEELDLIALTAEAMMLLTPWDLWDVRSGEPTKNSRGPEVQALLEKTIAACEAKGRPPHAGVLHLYIHTMEMSQKPERALRAADQLSGLGHDVGHLEHMPGHIYMLCGLLNDVKRVSQQAIIADRKYLAAVGPNNYYTASRCHDLHLLVYASMFLGQYATALSAAKEMAAQVTPALLQRDKPYMVATLEGYHSTWIHVLVRFGRWQEIIDETFPEDRALYPVSTAMMHYAKGVSQAALKQFDAAHRSRDLLFECNAALDPNRLFFNNAACDTMRVAEAMLEGELAYHQGAYDEAFDHLRRAVVLEDALHYSEPRSWMHPPRHALGALLLAQGGITEAERVYREDLGLLPTLARACQHPNNVWSLHGLHECLRKRGASSEARVVEESLKFALARADVPIRASCCCRESSA